MPNVYVAPPLIEGTLLSIRTQLLGDFNSIDRVQDRNDGRLNRVD